MRTLTLLFCLVVAAPTFARSPSTPDPVAVETHELSEALRELAAARAEMERVRSAVEQDLAARDAELAEVRTKLQRLEERDRPEPAGADRVAYGSAVRVARGERVHDVVAFGDDVHVEGHVAGDATSFGGSVFVADGGRVAGDAISFGGRVEVEDGGRVDGGRIAMGVPGVTPRSAPKGPLASGSVGALAEPGLLKSMYRRFILLLSFAGAGVLVVGLFPKRVGRIADALEANPIRSAMVGALGSGFLVLFSLLFAMITFGLGLPVSLMVVGLLGLAWLLGFVGLCQAVGDRLPFEQKPHGRWLAFLVGTVLLTCVGSLPLVGWLVVAGASTVGIGAALTTRFGGR